MEIDGFINSGITLADNTTFFNTSSELTSHCRRFNEMSIFATILTLTFFTNLTSAIAIWNLKGFAENKYHLVVRTLVISDVIIPFPILPLSIASYVNCDWLGGDMTCTISAIMSSLFLFWSGYIVVIMCVLRYMVVNMPIRYRQFLSQTRLRVVLAMGFLWVLFHLLLPVLGLGKFKLYEKGQYCALDLIPEAKKDKVLVYLTITEGTVILISLLFLTLEIYRSLNQRRRVSGQWSKQQKRGAGIQRTHKQHGEFAVLTLVIVVAFDMCYMPWLVYRMVVVTSSNHINEDAYFYTEMVAYINPLLNPFIYITFNKMYRKALWKFIQKWFILKCFKDCLWWNKASAYDVEEYVVEYRRRKSTLKTGQIALETPG